MTNLEPVPAWDDVRQLEANEYATGGAGGNMNEQALALTARTRYLDKYTASPYRTGKVYDLNERVQLESGDIVKSTAPNNTANPNIDMTGWVKTNNASQIFDASGKTQQEINDSIAVKFLVASEIGLTKWSDFAKPPYTTQQYEQAYNNGVNLTNAIKEAYDAGYNQVVLERGNYPFTYTSANNPSSSEQFGAVKLWNLTDVTVDLNNSVLFVIFDSNNRSPYTSVSTNPYQLGGAVITMQDTFGVVIKNGELRGDHYNRSYTNADERQTENTSGILFRRNNRHIEIQKCKFHGFRADGLAGFAAGESLGADVSAVMGTWYSGGLNITTGAEIVEAGSYRTAKVDLSGKAILNNQVNIGRLFNLTFRDDYLLVAFYGTDGNFISAEMVVETQNIMLPTNTRYVQFVAYKDERTDATVSYGNVRLYTGMSQYLFVSDCDFYRCMRGAISNLFDNTFIDRCRFFDTGVLKSEVNLYGYTTRYAINFEDVYVGNLSVTNCEFDNVGSAILAGCRSLTAKSNKFKNLEFTPIVVYTTAFLEVSGNSFYNAKYSLLSIDYNNTYINRYYVVCNNTAINCSGFAISGAFNSKFIFMHHDNYYYGTSVSMRDVGQGRTIYTHDNVYVNMTPASVYAAAFLNCASVHNEQVIDTLTTSNENMIKSFDTESIAHSNMVKSMTDFAAVQIIANRKSVTKNVEYTGLNATYVRARITGLQWDSAVNTTLLNNVVFDGCSFNNVVTAPAFARANTNAHPLNILYSSCKFKGISRVLDQTITDLSYLNSYSLNVTFDKCDLDVSQIAALMLIASDAAFPITLNLFDCRIYASTAKSLRLIDKARSNVVINIDNCSVKNVTFTDQTINYLKQATATYDPPSLAAGAVQSTIVTLAGAVVGNAVVCSFSLPLNGTRMWAEVTAVNTVTVYHQNPTGASVDLASGTLTVKLI